MTGSRTILAGLSAFVLLANVGCSSGAGDSSWAAGGENGGDSSRAGAAGSLAAGAAGKAGAAGSNGGSDSAGGSGGAPPMPTGDWVNVTANLANMPSECGNTSGVFAKPDEDLLIAGVALKGLWSSTDGGTSWKQLGDSAAITNRISGMVFDPDHSERFWESGIYNGGGVYQTTDDGAHFSALGDVKHVDLVSVDFSDADRKTLVAGGHEQEKTLSLSTDGGAHWSPIGTGLPAGEFCTLPLVIDAKTYVVGCYHFGSGTGIQRTTDSGATWTKVSSQGGASAPIRTSDGTIYSALGGNAGFVKSADAGKTWSAPMGVNTIKGFFNELPDHRLAAVGTEGVVVSSDKGATFQPATSALPFDPSSMTYSPQRKAFYVSHFSCGNPPLPVPSDAIMSHSFE